MPMESRPLDPDRVAAREAEQDYADNGLDESHIKECLREADELKSEGNDYFRSKRWDEALNTYRTGLNRLPKRKESKQSGITLPPDEEEDSVGTKGAKAEVKSDGTGTEVVLSEAERDCAKARAVLNANIAACYVKLAEYKEAVASCTEALQDDPEYVKALQRRAASNEKIDSWSSLASAQEDYETLLKILAPSSPLISETQRSLNLLKPRIEVAQKRETGEMMDKLKGLGNSILGNFGLSTDNFKFEPNGQGGYSMNFSR